MCMSATCDKCQKTTWRGCGNHVPGVFESVPKDQWCECEPKVTKEGHEYPPMKNFKMSSLWPFGS
ncbi:hypothetical protein BT63DRAFT_423337 [Microthyrium microscopicum]|uniref:Uncharacterized protein n=1 Tax=Microthyrium microscopicum TaxID=703497 RepID=A0A6A6UHP5_9PEZI|nr:hypothetical protein BT63DRAFT_423337 [Microthyrium microscopicum]